MATIDRELGRSSHSVLSARQILLLIILAAGIVAALITNGLIGLIVGHVPGWIWWAVVLVEVASAVFLAAVLFSSGPRADE